MSRLERSVLEHETAKVLAISAAYDNRNVTREHVRAWHLAIGDLFFPECAAAVTEHFKESTEWMKPAHVRRIVLAARQHADREAGRQKRELMDWCEANGIDWVRYSEGDPDELAAADRVRQEEVDQ